MEEMTHRRGLSSGLRGEVWGGGRETALVGWVREDGWTLLQQWASKTQALKKCRGIMALGMGGKEPRSRWEGGGT